MRLRAPTAALALPLALAACAHAPERPAAAPALQAAARPERVVVTGSRIPQRVEPATGLPATISPLRVITREQLLGTGRQDDLAAALRSLEPATGR